MHTHETEGNIRGTAGDGSRDGLALSIVVEVESSCTDGTDTVFKAEVAVRKVTLIGNTGAVAHIVVGQARGTY